MPARKVKTFLRNPKERKHREHRSRKGRIPPKEDWGNIERIRQREREIEDEESSMEMEEVLSTVEGDDEP